MRNEKLSYQCNIPDDAFTWVDGKEFCHLCQTSIVDFTVMSDEEIRAYISSQAGSVCVKIDSDQLRRVKGKKSSLQQHVGVAATAAILALAPAAEAQVNHTVKTVKVQDVAPDPSLFPVAVPVLSDTNTISCGENEQVPDDSVITKRPVKRWIFLRSGRRIFYVKNKFPFIGSKRMGLRGKF